MKKKILLLALVLMCVFALTACLGEEEPTADFIYQINEEGTGYIIKGINTVYSNDVVIPSEIRGLPVVGIDNCQNKYIKTVTIPDSVTSIGDDAFRGCDSLTYNEKDGVKYLGNSTHPYIVAMEADESITSVDLPNTVKVIYTNALYGCSSLTSITIPDSVTSIGGSAFGGCDSLTSITIPDSVTSIGGSAFNGCDNLTSITIPDSVTSIESGAFYKCTSLTSVTIPDGVTSIGSSAFKYCFSLTDIYFTGTEEEWNAIEKDSTWDVNTGNCTIHYNYIP